MLTRSRSSKTTRNSIESMNKKSGMNGKASEEKSQWIMIAPDDLLDAPAKSQDKKGSPVFHRILHPKSSQPTLYLFKSTKVFEIMRFKEQFGSWFIEDSVHSDGSLYILTPLDPLFLALPSLVKVAKSGKYMTKEQIFVDKEFQTGFSQLESCLTNSDLDTVCDCKGTDDFTAYKLNTDKVLSWLATKVERLTEHLEKENLHVGKGSQAANFVKSSHTGDCSHDDYVHYAFGLISDYISDEWITKLKDRMQLQPPSPTEASRVKEEEPPLKRQKLSEAEDGSCLEDYRDVTNNNDKTKKPAKLTNAQKQLAKIDKTGMKSLNSFFTVKQKTK